MRIESIVITLAPNEREAEMNVRKVALYRDEERLWTTSDERGFFPYQIKLINTLQEKVIEAFNGKE
jgi:hypothetical protein